MALKERVRFCVTFMSALPPFTIKTRILYRDGGLEDIRNIWQCLYNKEAPRDMIAIRTENDCEEHAPPYFLDDPEDFEAFMEIAKIQYQLQPTCPLSVILTKKCFPVPSRLLLDWKNHEIQSKHPYENWQAQVSDILDTGGKKVRCSLEIERTKPECTQNENCSCYLSSTLHTAAFHQKPEAMNDGGPIAQEKIFSSSAVQTLSSATEIPHNLTLNNIGPASSEQIENWSPAMLKDRVPDSLRRISEVKKIFQEYLRENEFNATTNEHIPSYSFGEEVGTKNIQRRITNSRRSRSNLQHHYKKAVAYGKMSENEKKLQESVPHSVWTHLLYIMKTSPSFFTDYENAKYDVWTAEARDIYAICQPEKYSWKFLTVQKGGDALCKRLIERIERLKLSGEEDKKEWKPSDSTLNLAKQMAETRLEQLQRLKQRKSEGNEC